VELAIVILMVTALAVISLPVIVRNEQRAIQTHCASHLRQIGLALQLYTQNHSDMLPGPLFPVPRASYDETEQQELACYLAESLSCPKPSKRVAVLPALVCSKYQRWATRAALAGIRSYALNENINRRGQTRVPPFGSSSEPVSGPLKLSALAEYGAPSSIFAMTDADKANVNPTLHCWEDLPYRPAHGRTRTRLFFDGHVEAESW